MTQDKQDKDQTLLKQKMLIWYVIPHLMVEVKITIKIFQTHTLNCLHTSKPLMDSGYSGKGDDEWPRYWRPISYCSFLLGMVIVIDVLWITLDGVCKTQTPSKWSHVSSAATAVHMMHLQHNPTWDNIHKALWLNWIIRLQFYFLLSNRSARI